MSSFFTATRLYFAWPWSLLRTFRLETGWPKCVTNFTSLLWTTTTWQSLPSISFPIPFSNPRMVEIEPSKLSVYPKKYAHGFCFAVLCCGYTLTDFPTSIRLTSLALWQSNDCPSASKATLMNMDKYFMWIHYEWLHNHNKAKHNKTVCIFLGIYCTGQFDKPASTPQLLFRCRSANIVCVYDINYCNTTMCRNKEEHLFYSLISVWCVTMPVDRSGSWLQAWSLACASPRWFRGSKFFLSGECTSYHVGILKLLD